MIKLHIIALASLAVIFTSCRKEEAPKIESKLLGRWTLELLHNVGNPEPFPNTDGMEYTFRADGTFSGVFIEAYYVNGKLIKNSVPYHGIYQVSNNGKQLILIEEGDNPDEYEIFTLSNSQLILRGLEDEYGHLEAIYTKVSTQETNGR